MRPALAALFALIPALAPAQHVAPCDGPADARGIVEPREDHIRSYGTGPVRVALTDTIDPAAGALHLLVLTPPYTAGMGERHCWIMGRAAGIGLVGLDVARMVSVHDPAKGLTFVLPARFHDPALEVSNVGLLDGTVNHDTGAVIAGCTVTGLD